MIYPIFEDFLLHKNLHTSKSKNIYKLFAKSIVHLSSMRKKDTCFMLYGILQHKISLRQKNYWPTLLSIPGKEPNWIGFWTK